MWMCPLCERKFVNTNQVHSCGDKGLDDFLHGKSEATLELFHHFITTYRKIGKITLAPAKSMIGIVVKTRIAYVIALGKNFVDVVFPFDRPHDDNLCFRKIAQVPGSQQFNHHLRIIRKEDVNEEVRKFMKLAYKAGE